MEPPRENFDVPVLSPKTAESAAETADAEGRPPEQPGKETLLQFLPPSLSVDVGFWRRTSELKLKAWCLDTPSVPLIASYTCASAKPIHRQSNPVSARSFRVSVDADAIERFQSLQGRRATCADGEDESSPVACPERHDSRTAPPVVQTPESGAVELASSGAASAEAALPLLASQRSHLTQRSRAGSSEERPNLSGESEVSRGAKATLGLEWEGFSRGVFPVVGSLRVVNTLKAFASEDLRAGALKTLSAFEEAVCKCRECQTAPNDAECTDGAESGKAFSEAAKAEGLMRLDFEEPQFWQTEIASEKDLPSDSSPELAPSEPGEASFSCLSRAVYRQLSPLAWTTRLRILAFLDLKCGKVQYAVCAPCVRPCPQIGSPFPPVRAAPPLPLAEFRPRDPGIAEASEERAQRGSALDLKGKGRTGLTQSLSGSFFTAAEIVSLAQRFFSLDEGRAPFVASGLFLLRREKQEKDTATASAESPEGELRLYSIEYLDQLSHSLPEESEEFPRSNLFLVFLDPAEAPFALGWPLRCVLPALCMRFKLFNKVLRILSFRDWLLDRRVKEALACVDARLPSPWVQPQSLVFFAKLPSAPSLRGAFLSGPTADAEAGGSVEGEEAAEKTRAALVSGVLFNPKATATARGTQSSTRGVVFSVDLSSFLDSATMQREAEELNTHLIRWRVLPAFKPPLLQRLRCLCIGAGTLGCSVARLLAGWGVK